MRDCGTKIVSVAVLYKPDKTDRQCPDYGYITISAPAPARHADVLRPLSQICEKAAHLAEQGFLTDTGEFLTRGAAKAFVYDVKQSTIRNTHPSQLFSEDLW
jgi:hypothetical protein